MSILSVKICKIIAFCVNFKPIIFFKYICYNKIKKGSVRMNVFQEKIKDYRKRNGLSQDDLASMLGISRSIIANWENDRTKPTPEMVDEISKKLGIQIEYSDVLDSNIIGELKNNKLIVDGVVDLIDLEKIINALNSKNIVLVYKGKEITNEDKIAMSTMIRMYLEVKRWL